MGWFSCTCPLVTGELVFREAGVNLKGRWVGEELFLHYVFLAPHAVRRDGKEWDALLERSGGSFQHH